MNIIPYRLSGRRLIVGLALPLFCLLVFQPTPQTIAFCVEPSVLVAQSLPSRVAPTWSFTSRQSLSPIVSYTKNAAQIPIPGFGGAKSEADIIGKSGPVFPAVFNMSRFSVKGFVQGLWPIVIEYELESESTGEVTIATIDGKQSFVIQLPPTNDKPQEVKRKLPEAFGKKPQVGVLSFEAFKTGPGQRTPARFFLYGLGVGDKAVGSMVIDQLQFQPGTIRPKQKEKASYSFHSLSDFNTGSADFMLVTLSADGVTRPQLVYREMLKDGIRRDASVRKDWDGKNAKGRISLGTHQFHVRVWRGLKSGGDWVFAAKKQLVRVE